MEAKEKKTLAFEVILHHHIMAVVAMVATDMVALLNQYAFLSLALKLSCP